MKHISKEAAIENIKKFFSQTTEDILSIEDAYLAWGRDPKEVKENKGWFSNKMIDLKYNNLVKPVYGRRNNRRVLIKIQLTMEGKKALGRVETAEEALQAIPPTSNGQNATLSIADAMKIVAKLRKENPDYEITFDIKLKGGIV